MVQSTLSTPEELFHYQLRSALTMEEHSLEALEELHRTAKNRKIQGMFSHHSDETKEQIENLNKVFDLFDFKHSTAPSPATTGIKNQAAGLIEKVDPDLYDQVTLMSALGNEHFEISAYTGLLMQAEALGVREAVKLLQSNLDQEVHTSDELRSTLKSLLL